MMRYVVIGGDVSVAHGRFVVALIGDFTFGVSYRYRLFGVTGKPKLVKNCLWEEETRPAPSEAPPRDHH
jgi:hypothetical protein